MPSDLSYFVDDHNQLSFEEVTKKEFNSNFLKHSSYHNSWFQSELLVLDKLTLNFPVHSEKILAPGFYDQTIDSLTAYFPESSGAYKRIQLGDHQKFKARILFHKNFDYHSSLTGGPSVYYFKIRSHEFADIRIALRSTSYFVYYALNEYYLYGMFYGMILIIALYKFYGLPRHSWDKIYLLYLFTSLVWPCLPWVTMASGSNTCGLINHGLMTGRLVFLYTR